MNRDYGKGLTLISILKKILKPEQSPVCTNEICASTIKNNEATISLLKEQVQLMDEQINNYKNIVGSERALHSKISEELSIRDEFEFELNGYRKLNFKNNFRLFVILLSWLTINMLPNPTELLIPTNVFFQITFSLIIIQSFLTREYGRICFNDELTHEVKIKKLDRVMTVKSFLTYILSIIIIASHVYNTESILLISDTIGNVIPSVKSYAQATITWVLSGIAGWVGNIILGAFGSGLWHYTSKKLSVTN
mgnify:CR=1 FL=1